MNKLEKPQQIPVIRKMFPDQPLPENGQWFKVVEPGIYQYDFIPAAPQRDEPTADSVIDVTINETTTAVDIDPPDVNERAADFNKESPNYTLGAESEIADPETGLPEPTKEQGKRLLQAIFPTKDGSGNDTAPMSSDPVDNHSSDVRNMVSTQELPGETTASLEAEVERIIALPPDEIAEPTQSARETLEQVVKALLRGHRQNIYVHTDKSVEIATGGILAAADRYATEFAIAELKNMLEDPETDYLAERVIRNRIAQLGHKIKGDQP